MVYEFVDLDFCQGFQMVMKGHPLSERPVLMAFEDAVEFILPDKKDIQ